MPCGDQHAAEALLLTSGYGCPDSPRRPTQGARDGHKHNGPELASLGEATAVTRPSKNRRFPRAPAQETSLVLGLGHREL